MFALGNRVLTHESRHLARVSGFVEIIKVHLAANRRETPLNLIPSHISIEPGKTQFEAISDTLDDGRYLMESLDMYSIFEQVVYLTPLLAIPFSNKSNSMASSSTYTLPPINAGDHFTCQGNGLLYDGVPRIPVDELRTLIGGGSGQTLAGNRKEPKKWFQAQCAHYGLPTKGVVAVLRAQLDDLVASPAARVPDDIAQLETEQNGEYTKLNERVRGLTTRAQSPAPGRTRRVTMSNVPKPQPTSSETPATSGAPRSRTKSLAPSSQAPEKDAEPDPSAQVPPKRGRGRPRKSAPPSQSATQPEQTNGREKQATLAIPSSKRPDPPSQQDSVASAYSELDDEFIEALDEVEKGIELMDTDADGDSQMNPPAPSPSPPVPARTIPDAPQTPRHRHNPSVMSPSKGSPKSTLERDVVSGMWSLRITSHNTPHLIRPQQYRSSNTDKGLKGTMNLHLAEDKKSLIGEFSLLGMDGVVQSKTLEGRVDGAYARLLFVGQMTILKEGANQGETVNRVLGPSPSQSGYLRFTDVRKGGDGRFMLKGTIQGEGYGKVDFEGVREGDEQDMCANWDDFVD
ncbi:hypothetical protein RhiJN_08262 [Ceratobasidium sp. AG-Ba]|nr:hypothetical protein RhiJN_08262 [Ceratobasidium sp. AG-Ba]QRW09049.1 hypothetical protein RhiLY_08048 [Ceratobasidium sp. AG-Ba]